MERVAPFLRFLTLIPAALLNSWLCLEVGETFIGIRATVISRSRTLSPVADGGSLGQSSAHSGESIVRHLIA